MRFESSFGDRRIMVNKRTASKEEIRIYDSDCVLPEVDYLNKINKWNAFIKDYYTNNPEKIEAARKLGVLILTFIPCIDKVLLANDFAEALSEFKEIYTKKF